MFENDNLEYQSDQMRWEYERAMWELAQKKQDKEQMTEPNNNQERQ